MRKLKFAYLLPPIQFIIFLTLIHWETVDIPYFGNIRGLCFAINSPGLLFYDLFLRMAPVRWLPPYVSGIRSDRFIFFAGVVVLWYFIGRELDKLRSPKTSTNPTIGFFLGNLLVIAVGIHLIYLLRMGWIGWWGSGQRPLSSDIVDSAITLTWAFILILLPIRRLAKYFLRRRSNLSAA